ncbi:MAG: SMP-30/gluconolactonase/LRE family protein [Hyphomonadaceae bacterium]
MRMTVLAAIIAAGCAQEAAPVAENAAAPTGSPSLSVAWELGGLANPESVAVSSDGSFFYVSNVNGEGEAKDGNGFISRVSPSGELIEREWARGLDAPKGMMAGGDAVYVTDIDQLVVLDATTGVVRRRVAAEGAGFLNDLAFAPDGQVLMTDSATQRIYGVRSDTAEVWLEHELLAAANGLLPEPERLLVTTMQGRLLSIDYDSRAVTVLAEGLGDADGIAAIGGDRYLVSAWPGEMFVVNAADGTHERILDTRAEGRFLNDFLLVGDTLYQPNWEPSSLTAYSLTR